MFDYLLFDKSMENTQICTYNFFDFDLKISDNFSSK